MTLKRTFWALMAALAVFACTPGATLDDGSEPEEEQTAPNEGTEEPDGPSHPDDPQDDDDRTRVSYGTVDGISATEGTLYGSFDDALAAPAQAGFEWGLSASALTENIASQSSVSGQRGEFSAKLTGLAPDTEYFFRAYIQVPVNGENRTYRSAVSSFRTEAAESPQQASQPGWFELPVVDCYITSDGWRVDRNNPDLYYAYHKSDIGTRNYTVCYNGAYHCPVWIAAPRHSIYSVGSGRSSYSFDPDIPKSVQQASTSGSTSGYNRGHMLGSAERTGSTLTNKQVFYVTNIAPQGDPWFNSDSGGWNPLEKFIDGFESSDTLYVVIGAYFENFTDGYGNNAYKKTALFMGSDVQIPTMFYYACLRTKSGNSGKSLKNCTRDEIMCAAFVRAHSSGTAGQAVSKKEMMSIDDLEALTGFDYFTAIPNAPEDSFNPADWGLE